MHVRFVAAFVAALTAAAPLALATPPPSPGGPPDFVVLNGQGNRLVAYDGSSGNHQTVIRSAGDAAASTDPDDRGLDINAQICVHEHDGETYFIAGEDTSQGGSGGSPGWGWFKLDGKEVGRFKAVEEGKLIPTWTQPEGQENYGCGFLDDGRLLLSDVGAQLPHETPSGQLHVWFPNSDGTGFDDSTFVDLSEPGPIDVTTDIDNRTDGAATGQHFCMIDTSIGTAGGMMVRDGWVYVASNRPGPNGTGGIYRYDIATIPTDAAECKGIEQDLVTAGVVTRELWLPSDPFVLTPSAIAPSGRVVADNPTFYVSSVFTGVIAEYVVVEDHPVHLRNVVEPPAGAPVGQVDDARDAGVNDGGTPYGIGVGPDGSLWYADLGIQGAGPVAGHGSVQRVTFDSSGAVRDRLVVEDGLEFPDGIGVLELGVREPGHGRGRGPAATDPDATSERECEWAMYGHGATRDFAVPDACESPISRTSVAALQPAWKVKTEATVTASPAVVGGNVYVGDWTGTMHKIDADDGIVQWTHTVEPAPGAAFGPIVSSAAVVDVDDVGRLVVFGAGPVLYALRDGGTSATRAWTVDLSGGNPFVEIESSPVVWRGIAYVGFGNHNHEGTGVPGGLLALDVATGEELWRFEPELGDDVGCGTVWSSPALDTTDDSLPLVYLATGNCAAEDVAWTPHTEAVTALDARNGAVVWTFQPHVANRKDWDFGATPNVFTDAAGNRVLGIGNKDGVYYALDAGTGALRWSTKAAMPGDVREDFSIGGFLGSTGAYGGSVFGATAIGGAPTYHAMDATTGAMRWQGAQAPSYSASAAVNGIVFAPALDSMLRGYDLETGAVLFAAPLLGPGSSGPAIVGDTVIVGSGTSSSDACAKDLPPEINEQCLALFDQVLGGLGGIEAFRLPVALPSIPGLR